ncbi:hypothetical protein BDV98DRAFT_508545 [Pterulicium gracile]|uniref:Uncharacterized protein n=1 Tax=Pterulicium gracile TaxID=1884261 RepID=A0A5C3QQS8_9AGAR|nr:hypothetical protein BDV98DRAFT_508545 [Pterula gracilis]
MNRNRIFTRDEVHHIVAENEQRRSKLLTLDVIRWCDLPWPMLRKPETPEDITLGGIDGYVRNPYHPEQGRSERDRVKDHIKYWHPDRFETKLLPRVPEEEQEMVKTGAGIVARTLNELMSSVG